MVSEMGRKVLEKLNEQKGNVLSEKMDEIDKLLKPYTTIMNNGMTELVRLPDDLEVNEMYDKLNQEFLEIMREIKLIDCN